MFPSYASLAEAAVAETSEQASLIIVGAGSAFLIALAFAGLCALWARLVYHDEIPSALRTGGLIAAIIPGVIAGVAIVVSFFLWDFEDWSFDGTRHAVRMLAISVPEAERLALDYANVVGLSIIAEAFVTSIWPEGPLISCGFLLAGLIGIGIAAHVHSGNLDQREFPIVCYAVIAFSMLALVITLSHSMPATPAMSSLKKFERYVSLNGVAVLDPLYSMKHERVD